MKLTWFLILVLTLQASASLWSQTTNLNLKLKNKTLLELFIEIENNSEYRFFYSNDDIDVKRKISVNAENQPIGEILNEAFKDLPYSFRELKNNIILVESKTNHSEVGNLAQQQKTVTGTVTDDTGQPLPGVTIVVKGTTQGTVTNIDGNYTISSLPGNAVLVFSFVGMKTQEIKVGNQSTINITLLQETIGIEEVVAIGYGTQKKENLTSSVVQIGRETLENRPVKSVAESLQGVIAGLNVDIVDGSPKNDLNLNIRGFTGFNTQGSPLILVDGVERVLGDININDVETVTVLKDAAASAIYGSRAPFGVILVTTRSGKRGEKIRVNYSGNYRIGSPFLMPHMADSWVFAERQNEAFRNVLKAPGFSAETIQQMKDYASGKIDYNNVPLASGQWGAHWISFDNIDWFDYLTKDVIPSQEHNVNFSGGSENTTYYMGLGYNESTGIFEGLGDHKNRYSALLKVNTDATDWLNLNLSMNYINTDQLGPGYNQSGNNYNTIFNVISRTWPNWPAVNPNGSPHWLSPRENLLGKNGTQSIDANIIAITGGFKLEPIKGWNITGDYTWRYNNNRSTWTQFPLTVINADGTVRPSGRAPNQSSVAKSVSETSYHTVNLFTSYTREIGKNYFHVLAGYQEELSSYEYLYGKRSDLYTFSVPTLRTAYGDQVTTDALSHWASQGYFFRFSYNYSEKYLLEINGRYDAHSKFPKDIRWAFFPSFSAGWNIAKENFWPVEAINNFKLRGSYTSSGDNGSGNYLYLPTMGTGSGVGDVILGDKLPPMVFMPGLISDKLTWAKPKTLGLGLDVTAIDNRLDLTYDWYQRTVYDQAGPAEPLPETLGTAVPRTNNAVSETRGWEFSAKWRDKGFTIIKKPLNYFAQFNISDYIGYVVKYSENITGTRSGQWTPGQEFGKLYLYESNGIAQTIDDVKNNVSQGGAWYYPGDLMMKDLNGDGQINAGEGGNWYAMGDQIAAGYNYPRYRYGINLGADWNGFDFSIMLDGTGLWKMYANSSWVFGSEASQWSGGWFKEHEELGVWSPETPDAFYPRYEFSSKNYSRPNDQFMLNLANLRIRNIKLGYSLPSSIVNRVKLNRVYLYTSIENAGFIFYKSWIKYDPEIISNFRGQGYPTQRVISFGVNITI